MLDSLLNCYLHVIVCSVLTHFCIPFNFPKRLFSELENPLCNIITNSDNNCVPMRNVIPIGLGNLKYHIIRVLNKNRNKTIITYVKSQYY